MDSIELNEPDEEGKPTYRPPADIPAALAPWADQSWFVGWAAEQKNRRWTKVPKDARTGRNASVSDRRTWAPAATALDGVERHGHDGIGLVLTEEAGIIGIDLDDCINDAGLLSPLAAEIISYGETYAEVSPSGNGIRLFVLGKIDRPLKDDKAGVEVYAKDRYLTITGNHIDGTPREVREDPAHLLNFCHQRRALTAMARHTTPPGMTSSPTLMLRRWRGGMIGFPICIRLPASRPTVPGASRPGS